MLDIPPLSSNQENKMHNHPMFTEHYSESQSVPTFTSQTAAATAFWNQSTAVSMGTLTRNSTLQFSYCPITIIIPWQV